MRYNYVEIARQIVLKHIDKTQYDVFIFGSRAAGTNKEMSDIDIGILGNKALSVLVKSDIEEALVESIVPFKVDLIDFTKVSSQFKTEALKKIIYWNKTGNE